MVVDKYIDLRENMGFRHFVKLSNGIIGKLITSSTGHITKYMITESGDVYDILTESKAEKRFRNDPKNPEKPWYVEVKISTAGCKDGVITPLVHRLLALAFIPNPENKPTVNHKDGDKTNYKLDNLEWATYSENNIHAIVNGLRSTAIPDSESCNLTTHTKEDVLKVANLLEEGVSPKNISAKYGYGYEFVYKIYNRETWKPLTQNFRFPPLTRTKHSNVFTAHELYKMIKLFIDGKTVREVISEMGWEYNELMRGRVKFIKYNVDRGRYTIDQYNNYCESVKSEGP